MPHDSIQSVHTTNTDSSSSLREGQRLWYPLFLRLHFYIGLIVGPFILIAAFTGALYALTPQIENFLYKSALYTDSTGKAASLQEQIQSARTIVGDSAVLSAVRPAPTEGKTTRVMFSEPIHQPGEQRAIFIDPVTTKPVGDFTVYGTSGALPFRTWIDYLHRGLHMGDLGRYYSELAASWLWIAALSGLGIWYASSRRLRSARMQSSSKATHSPIQTERSARKRLRSWHSTTGLVILIGLLFFSVTGLTWSQWAGENISVLRSNLNWGTPNLNTALGDSATATATATATTTTTTAPADDAHAHHINPTMHAQPELERFEGRPAQFDQILSVARNAGIDAGLIEIKPARESGKAWTVIEIDRSWPTQVDGVAIDPASMAVVDRITFAEFPLAAKLTRWGIDAHMGVLFGVPNQLFVAAVALSLCAMIIWGYMMWWRRRSAFVKVAGSKPLLITNDLRRLPLVALVVLGMITSLVGWFLPVMGISLIVFLVIDFFRFVLHQNSNARKA